MDQETHPFQVSIWLAGNDKPRSLFERGLWVEQARCSTTGKAIEVATCLSLRWPAGVQIAEAQEGRFVPYKFIPETAKDLK